MLTPLSRDLGRYMDLLAERQRLVAANLANIDTPGYLTKDIDFQFEFLSLGPGGRPHVIEPAGLVMKNDGNNVSLDREASGCWPRTRATFQCRHAASRGPRSANSGTAIEEGRGA